MLSIIFRGCCSAVILNGVMNMLPWNLPAIWRWTRLCNGQPLISGFITSIILIQRSLFTGCRKLWQRSPNCKKPLSPGLLRQILLNASVLNYGMLVKRRWFHWQRLKNSKKLFPVFIRFLYFLRLLYFLRGTGKLNGFLAGVVGAVVFIFMRKV